jgi:hypothetical protein
MINFRITIVWLIALAGYAAAQEQSVAPKQLDVIQWSAVEPRLEYLATANDRIAELPFTGVVTVMVADDGTELIWNLWNDRKFELTDFKNNQTALEQLAQRTNNFKLFARFNMPTQAYDWNDESRWQQVLHHTGLLAQLATHGKFTGIVLDTEQYGEQVFKLDYQATSKEQRKALVTKMRERGSQWIETLETQWKSQQAAPTIVLTFGYKATQPGIGDGRDNVSYTLLEPFLDGVLDSIDDDTRLIDGWEYSYGFRDVTAFAQAHDEFADIHSKVLLRSRVEQGFGLWIDYAPNKHGWNVDNVEANFFTPRRLRGSIRAAHDHGCGLVWIYSKRPNWWTGELLPDQYTKAIRDAIKPPEAK